MRKVHFTSPHIWNFLSPRVTTKPPQNAFNFHSAKASIWVHIDTGIRMWFTEFYKTYRVKCSLSAMKISKSNCNKKKNKFNFDSIKNTFWVHKVSGIKMLFPNFQKKLCSGFLKKKAHFTSPPLWKFPSANVAAKPPKNPFNFDSVQNSFWVHKITGIRIYLQDFTKNYRVVFEKSSHYFTSHMKISKSKSNNKTPQNPFNFDSIKTSFWVHIDTGIRMLFTKFYKNLSSKMLPLPYESF